MLRTTTATSMQVLDDVRQSERTQKAELRQRPARIVAENDLLNGASRYALRRSDVEHHRRRTSPASKPQNMSTECVTRTSRKRVCANASQSSKCSEVLIAPCALIRSPTQPKTLYHHHVLLLGKSVVNSLDAAMRQLRDRIPVRKSCRINSLMPDGIRQRRHLGSRGSLVINVALGSKEQEEHKLLLAAKGNALPVRSDIGGICNFGDCGTNLRRSSLRLRSFRICTQKCTGY